MLLKSRCVFRCGNQGYGTIDYGSDSRESLFGSGDEEVAEEAEEEEPQDERDDVEVEAESKYAEIPEGE